MLVLIHNIQLGLDGRQGSRILGSGIKKFILDEELDLVTLPKDLTLLTAGSVHLDLLGANEFIHKGLRQPLDGLGQELIQALSCVVLLDGDDAHNFSFWGNG